MKKIGKEKIEGKKMWVKKENPKKSGGKKKWGCQIGKNGGRLKYFLQKILQKYRRPNRQKFGKSNRQKFWSSHLKKMVHGERSR